MRLTVTIIVRVHIITVSVSEGSGPTNVMYFVEYIPDSTPMRSWCDGSEVKVEEYT